MNKEAKGNLIFLVALLVLSMPGLVMLIGKALRGEGGLNASPPSVAVSTPYLNPVGTGTGVVRAAPPATLAWVDEQAALVRPGPADRTVAAGGRPVPIIGESRSVELLTRQPPAVLIWLHRRGEPVTDVSAEIDGRPFVVTSFEEVDVPKPVIRELQAYGYPGPPQRAVRVQLAEDLPSRGRLRIAWQRPDGNDSDVLENPAVNNAGVQGTQSADNVP